MKKMKNMIANSTYVNLYRRRRRDDIRFRRTVSLGTYPQGCKVLDIGSLDGKLRNFLPDGIEYVALDQDGCDLNTEKLPYTSDAFDYVFILEVLEHVHRPVEALAECARVGKRIILSVPNPLYFQDVIRHVFRVDIEPHGGHVNSFLYQNVCLICRKCELKITAETTTSFLSFRMPIKLLSRHQVFLLDRKPPAF